VTEIINGIYKTNESSANSNGGTEQMAKRMVRDINPDLLQGFQIIHSRVRELDPDLKKILVLHDLADDPEVAKLADPEYRKQFEKLVFVSNWQFQQYNTKLGVPYSHSVVIPNAIEPIAYPLERTYEGPIKLIYHTTPHRGLNILYAVFEKLEQEFDITLDVYSSFGVYGWEHRDEQYRDLFDLLDKHPRINNHGAKPNEVIREALINSDVFAYPSIWPETSCIAAIEALCAGVAIVHPNYAALPETTNRDAFVYQWDEDINTHANIFYEHLRYVLKNIRDNPSWFSNTMKLVAVKSNNYYNWGKNVKPKWEALLTSLR
jgi:UDP-glucose:(glucosyl)LPS alpha-1,2-glucosyltransferase